MLDILFTAILLFVEPATQPASLARLEAIDARAQQIRSISADFIQEKRSPLLSDAITTRGTLAATGSNVLWSATEPESSQTQVSDTQLQIYYPRQNLVEQYTLTPATAALAASPLPKLSALQATFELIDDAGEGLPLREGTIAIRLNPRDAELSKYVDHVRVLLDVDRAVVVAFEMTDPDGEVTLTRFERIVTNAKLDDADVTLRLPANVKRVSPGGSAR